MTVEAKSIPESTPGGTIPLPVRERGSRDKPVSWELVNVASGVAQEDILEEQVEEARGRTGKPGNVRTQGLGGANAGSPSA